MQEVVQVAALVCQLMGKPPKCQTPAGSAKSVATLIVREARRYDIDPRVLATVIRHESGYKPEAIGRRGELGLCQLYRGTVATAGYDHLSDDQLMVPWLNIRLGARRLARAAKQCGGGGPENYLGPYNGRGCGRNLYSRKILTRLHDAETPCKVSS